jgi:hypothetical protein
LTDFKETKKIVELTVNVTTDSDGRTEFEKDGLLKEDGADRLAEKLKLIGFKGGRNHGGLVFK